MSLLDSRRSGELMLTHCVKICPSRPFTYWLLSWTGKRVPIYLFYTIFRSLGFHVVPKLVVSSLASFGARRERRGASGA